MTPPSTPATRDQVCDLALGDILRLNPLAGDRFRASTFQRNNRGAIFGGCFLGQACVAAQATVADRPPSAMFARFLGPGDAARPVDYEVQTNRDGQSFSERRVLARQGGGPVIFETMISFHSPEAGFEHAMPIKPYHPDPEHMPAILDLPSIFPDIREDQVQSVGALRAIDCRLLEPQNFFTRRAEPRGGLWLKGRGCDVDTLGYAVLAFLADYMMPVGALMPHVASAMDDGVKALSLNQAIWFHGSPDPKGWLIHEFESPWAGSGRGLTLGRIYNRAGRFLASTSQELLIRRPSA